MDIVGTIDIVDDDDAVGEIDNVNDEVAVGEIVMVDDDDAVGEIDNVDDDDAVAEVDIVDDADNVGEIDGVDDPIDEGEMDTEGEIDNVLEVIPDSDTVELDLTEIVVVSVNIVLNVVVDIDGNKLASVFDEPDVVETINVGKIVEASSVTFITVQLQIVQETPIRLNRIKNFIAITFSKRSIFLYLFTC